MNMVTKVAIGCCYTYSSFACEESSVASKDCQFTTYTLQYSRLGHSYLECCMGNSKSNQSPIGQTRWKDGGNWLLDEAIDMYTLMLGNAHNYVVGLISRNEERAALPKKTEI